MFRPLMAQPCMGGVGRGRLAERFRSLRQAGGDCVPPSPKDAFVGKSLARISWLDPTWVALPGPLLLVATTWNSMLEWIRVVLLGPPLRLIC